jgi:hypothetical protein
MAAGTSSIDIASYGGDGRDLFERRKYPDIADVASVKNVVATLKSGGHFGA